MSNASNGKTEIAAGTTIEIKGGELTMSKPPGKAGEKPGICPSCGTPYRHFFEIEQGACAGCGPGSLRWQETHPDEPAAAMMHVGGAPPGPTVTVHAAPGVREADGPNRSAPSASAPAFTIQEIEERQRKAHEAFLAGKSKIE
jgi:hypothetical protein